MSRPVFRFAPSPNGRLHLGHACSALLNVTLAKAFDGQFLLRIEDIDTVRCTAAFEAAVYEDLTWLGLQWEQPVRRQSEHFATYRVALGGLRARGLLYPCFCSRKEIQDSHSAGSHRDSAERQTKDPDGAPLYPGTCRRLSAAEVERRLAEHKRDANLWPHTWRLDMGRALAAVQGPYRYRRFAVDGSCRQEPCDPSVWGDPVLARRDVPTSYHLSVVIDDWLQGVTHVVRGVDLEAATSLHSLLQRLVGVPSPAYLHHGLIVDEGGGKLSKSRLSKSLADLRAEGMTTEQARDACRCGNAILWSGIGR